MKFLRTNPHDATLYDIGTGRATLLTTTVTYQRERTLTMLPLPSALKIGIALCCAAFVSQCNINQAGTYVLPVETNQVVTTDTLPVIMFSTSTTTTSTTTTTTTIVHNAVEPRHTSRWANPDKTYEASLPPAGAASDIWYRGAYPPGGSFDSIPFLIDNQYGFYEKGNHIVELQRLLGMRFVDGIYGPDTRELHMNWFGSTETAQRYFYNRGNWWMETHDPEMDWKHNWMNWDEPPSLQQLVDIYFLPEDRAWAFRVAFCESSALPSDTYSNSVSTALAVGWFQHISRYWLERSVASGWQGYDIFDTEPNVAVAAWLFYESGDHHWNPSKKCWGGTTHG